MGYGVWGGFEVVISPAGLLSGAVHAHELRVGRLVHGFVLVRDAATGKTPVISLYVH